MREVERDARLRDRLARERELLEAIDERREQCDDLNYFKAVERRIIRRHLEELHERVELYLPICRTLDGTPELVAHKNNAGFWQWQRNAFGLGATLIRNMRRPLHALRWTYHQGVCLLFVNRLLAAIHCFDSVFSAKWMGNNGKSVRQT